MPAPLHRFCMCMMLLLLFAAKTNRGRRAASTVRRSSPRTVEAARRPQFVMTTRRASSEDKTLWSKACRHQDSQESSGDDKMAPYRVRARAPSSGSERVRSPKMASAAGRRAVRVRPLRTIPGCPDAYKRCSARPYPHPVRGAPSKRTAAAARPRWCKGSIGGSICVATLINRGLLPLPATSHLSHHSADLLY